MWCNTKKICNTHFKAKDFGLGKNWREAHIKGNVVLIYETTCFFRHLVHYPFTNRAQGASVVLTHISRVVAHRSKNPVSWVWYKPMGPEEFRSWVEVCCKFKHWVAQLLLPEIKKNKK